MTLPVYRLRRLLAAIAILLTLTVAGMYFYARSKAINGVKKIPAKIGFGIKQTAEGFQFSKSDGNRTLFTVQASNLKEFKLNGNAELHNVSIVLYGRDSSRFDQIYGDDLPSTKRPATSLPRAPCRSIWWPIPQALPVPISPPPRNSRIPST